MNQKKNRKVSVELSPVQLIWLHSQHLFQKIQEDTMLTNNQVKFYKNNNGVQLRYQRTTDEANMDVITKAKQQLQKIISENQIRLMPTSLHKEIYVRISRQARRQFPKTYIIFLHYETFQNCCRKLKEKFSITSITPQFQKLQKQNHFFCFLIAQKSKIEQVEKYTMRILNSQISCASTTFSNNTRSNQTTNICKRTMSVSSLRGSFTSYDEHNQIQQCRLSVNNSEGQEEMFEVSEISLVNLSNTQMQTVLKRNYYIGCKVSIQQFQGNYLYMRKKLYYANRLQLSANPHIQPIYAYSMIQKNMNIWKLSFITDRKYIKLNDLIGTVHLHSPKSKIDILVKVAKALLQLHRNRQSYGNLKQQNVLLDNQNNVYLSSIIDKNIPPYSNPFSHDIRQYLLLTYRIVTEVQMTSQCLNRKYQNDRYFCSLSHKCKWNQMKQFLNLIDMLFIEDITFEDFLKDADILIKG